jgi:predicted amidohydrolase
MKITVLEIPAQPGHVFEKLDAIEREFKERAPGDLVLLGEASLTGYLPDPTPLAEPRDGPTARRLAQLSAEFNTVVVGPLIEREGEHVYNAMVAPGCFHYRKRHPWYVESWATPGTEPAPVVEVAGRRVTICVCFDIHFLQHVDADILLFPSAWVDETGCDARPNLLSEIARKFNVAVVNANWGPGVPRVHGQGQSLVVTKEGIQCKWVKMRQRIDVVL